MKKLTFLLLAFLFGCGAEQTLEPKLIMQPPPNQIQQKLIVKKWPNKELEKQTNSALSQLVNNASLAFSLPEAANIDQDINAQLIVAIDEAVEKVAKELTVKGTVTTANFKTSRVVTARLVAPDFMVTAVEDEEQVILENRPAVWNWILTPKSAGKYDIMLTVNAKVEVNGKEKTSHIKTFEKKLTIEITHEQIVKRWVKNKWETFANWIWTVLLVPGFFWLKNKWQKRKSRRNP